MVIRDIGMSMPSPMPQDAFTVHVELREIHYLQALLKQSELNGVTSVSHHPYSLAVVDALESMGIAVEHVQSLFDWSLPGPDHGKSFCKIWVTSLEGEGSLYQADIPERHSLYMDEEKVFSGVLTFKRVQHSPKKRPTALNRVLGKFRSLIS
jgi:hypothetical protein